LKTHALAPKFEFAPALHGLRAVSAYLIMLFHWSQLFPGGNGLLAQWHWPGVPWLNPTLPFALGFQALLLFFVLSGYLLMSHWLNRPLTVHTVFDFYRRRALRIYPAVWFQIMVFLSLWTVLPLLETWPTWTALWHNALLWIGLPPSHVGGFNGVWWSLPIELMFYVVLPGLVLWVRCWNAWSMLLACVLVSLVWRWGVMLAHPGQSMEPLRGIMDALPGVLSTFAMGMAAACWQHRVSAAGARRLWVAGLSGLVLCEGFFVTNVSHYWQPGAMMLIWYSALAAAMAALVLAACRGHGARLLQSRWLVWSGEVSMGIYLWHMPVMHVFQLYWPEGDVGVWQAIASALAMLAITLALAALSFYMIERPAMKWKKQNA
jgi:peptidoglycan/LPS O-acetylase OafA/YrhL